MDNGSGTDNGVRHGIAEPAQHGDESTVLLGYLRRQRDLVAWKVGDASDGVLRSVESRTGLTVHGVVRHLTNVERSWLRDRFAGQTGLSFDWTDDDPDGELHVPPDITMADLLSDYAAEAKRCDEVIGSHALDATSSRGGFSLRWILLHLVEETSRHLGHLDLLRENADGRTGEGPEH